MSDAILKKAAIDVLLSGRCKPKFEALVRVRNTEGKLLTIVGMRWTSFEVAWEQQSIPGWTYFCESEGGVEYVEAEAALELAEAVAGGVA